jgi:hypothetical protein
MINLHVLACNSAGIGCGGGAPAPAIGSGALGILLTLVVSALAIYAGRKACAAQSDEPAKEKH